MMIRHLALHLTLAMSAFAADIGKEDVAGRRMSLMDEKKIEVYRFSKDGVALAQLGTKDGPIAPPAFMWKIEAGRLVITDEGRVVDSFELLERKDRRLKLRRRNGEIVVFHIERVDE